MFSISAGDHRKWLDSGVGAVPHLARLAIPEAVHQPGRRRHVGRVTAHYG